MQIRQGKEFILHGSPGCIAATFSFSFHAKMPTTHFPVFEQTLEGFRFLPERKRSLNCQTAASCHCGYLFWSKWSPWQINETPIQLNHWPTSIAVAHSEPRDAAIWISPVRKSTLEEASCSKQPQTEHILDTHHFVRGCMLCITVNRGAIFANKLNSAISPTQSFEVVLQRAQQTTDGAVADVYVWTV